MSRASSAPPRRRAGSGASVIARSVLFNLCLWLWTLAMLLAALPWLAAPPRRMLAHSRAWMRGVQFLLSRIVGLDYEVRGREHKNALAIFAFKHQSAWETLAIHLEYYRETAPSLRLAGEAA